MNNKIVNLKQMLILTNSWKLMTIHILICRAEAALIIRGFAICGFNYLRLILLRPNPSLNVMQSTQRRLSDCGFDSIDIQCV